MSTWKWIQKILGRPSEEELTWPSEEELAQTVHDIASPTVRYRGWAGGLVTYLYRGEEGFAEAERLLGSHASRGFEKQDMHLRWLPDHKIRDTDHLGWVSDGWTRIVVTLNRTYPKEH